jgi:ElaB/YqjD/DUF883 family membrane-anchored ribosome-binding protein
VNHIRFLITLLVFASIAGCSAAYYGALENVGIEKRDILVDRVDDARDSQDDASEQFVSALEQYRSVVDFDGGDLEKIYDRLNREYERSAEKAEDVRDRINSVERVAEDLFEEWAEEIEEYNSAELKRNSTRLLSDTRSRYGNLLKAMRKAEKTMNPVLEAFQDQVLVLKHNLNAMAIGSLRSELDSLERDTARLVAEMQKSIAEADEFIRTMKS